MDARAYAPLRSRRALILTAVGGPVLELAIVRMVHLPSAAGLAPQLTSPSPFGVFHDVRWLLVYHSSWLAFGFELAALIAFRSLFTAAMIRWAWPDENARPPFRATLTRAAVFTVASVVLLTPWAALIFGMAVTPVSWLFFAGVAPAVIIAMLIHHGAVARDWWRRSPTLRSVGWIFSTFVAMSLAAAAITVAPLALGLIAAAAAGLYNAWAWSGVVNAVASRRERTRMRFNPFAPAGVVVLLILVVGGVALGLGRATDLHRLQRAVDNAPPQHGHPVLVVRGFGSRYDGISHNSFGKGIIEWRFSYAGVRDGAPLAYLPADTQQALGTLVDSLGRQVDMFSASVGAPVSIVAESEGALVAKLYLALHPDAPVRDVIMLSPLVEPGRVFYPARGADSWGVASGWTLRAIARLLGAITPFRVSPDGPLLRDIEDHAPEIQRLLVAPLAHIPEHVIAPLADGVATPYDLKSRPISVLPAFHGGLMSDARVRTAVIAQLSSGELPTFGTWAGANALIRAAASAWQVPSLAPGLNPAWRNVRVV